MTKFGWGCLAFSWAFVVTMFFTDSPFLIAVLTAMALISLAYAIVAWLDSGKPALKIDDREWRAQQKRRSF